MIITTEQLLRLDAIQDQAVGGKAKGLKRLIEWGLKVPDGFVIVDAAVGRYPEQLAEYYQAIGAGKVAVRSSALSEDGEQSSFAGQYETVLNVTGIEQLQQAIDRCVASLASEQAAAYQAQQAVDETQMCVVVQQMVDAKAAGVLFSADPVSGRHDRLVIDAIDGLGEALVSGTATPDHYLFNDEQQLVEQSLIGERPILSDTQQQQLLTDAKLACAKAGAPLDMEWAIDQQGQLYWLQARPITTLGSDLHELDTPIKPGDVLTRCNIGEMMPGASCPLTFATTGRAIEYGMQHMHSCYAGRAAITEEWTQVAMSQGSLFLNLTGAAAAAKTVLGVDVKSLGLSVCGRIIDELEEPQGKKPIWIRLHGMWKLLRYLQQADSVIADFQQRLNTFAFDLEANGEELARQLDQAQALFYQAFCVHLQSSTTSGFASNILQAIISGGQQSSPEEEAEAAALMAGAKDVESAVLVEQLDHIVEQIADQQTQARQFVEQTSEQALAWLQNHSAPDIRDAFAQFLSRHGHRAYRELCMREPCWADAPETLVASMQASVNAKLQGINASVKPKTVELDQLKPALRWILPKAHNAVRRREATKSMLVDVTNRLKRAYRRLGEQLVIDNKLSDSDQVFFFTHSELMEFVQFAEQSTVCEHWQHRCNQRRIALNFQNQFIFDEINVGKPEPLSAAGLTAHSSDSIIGRPVSRGVIEAKARVALNLAEAAALQAGEILVAPITDVGWTPYFNMIAGLITDVGSAVSHGAVIAREYGLPAIVNTRIATQHIQTGDLIRLDANSGEVRILNPREH
ncbi:MAG: pyruvate, water dikinase [Pseudomonadales bacterium]|nr:pyruvate, water dikinase [Pseudomonadales bacterium]